MRRSLAGLLFIVSFVLFALSIGSWWMQRVAFTPSANTDSTYSILRDDDIRRSVATQIAQHDAPTLSVETAALRDYIEDSTRIYDGSALMNRFVSEAHARLIGDRDEPVVITPAEQVMIVRSEHVALEPDIALTVSKVDSISIVNTLAGWVTLFAAGFGAVLLIAGLIMRPERGEFTFALSIGFGALAIFTIVFGYLVPLGALGSLSDATWTGLFSRLATKSRNPTLIIAVISGVIAAAIYMGTSSLRQRRQRSTPLAVGRYREQHSWSR